MGNWGILRAYSLTAAVGVLVGCAGNAEPEVEKGTAALGIECANAAPTQVFCHALEYQSPFSYDTTSCFKGVVLDVHNYNGNLGTTSATLATRVRWGSSVPAAADCLSAVVLSDLFEIVGSEKIHLASKSAYGQLVSGVCLVPSLTWGSEMVRGHSYRVSASARRTSASSAPTRSVIVETLANGAADLCVSQTVDDHEVCSTDSCDPATGTVARAIATDGTQCAPSAFAGLGSEIGLCESGACSVATAAGGAPSGCR